MKYTVHYNGVFAEGDSEGANQVHFMVLREAMAFAEQVAQIDPEMVLQNNWDGTKMKWSVDAQSLYWA